MRFLGNKDSIIDQIRGVLCKAGLTKHHYRLFDAFCGSGSVSDALKGDFDLVINDIMTWSVIFTHGRILAHKVTFDGLGFDPFSFLNSSCKRVKGFFYKNYSPGGSARMYLTAENAARVDYFRRQIEEWKVGRKITDDEYAVLIASLVESVSSVSNTAGVYGAFLKKWDARAQKPIVFQKVVSAFGQCGRVESYQGKIEDVIGKVECDVLYLDPPYTQNQYGTQYHLLETLVLDDNPKISAITGSRSTAPYRSDWSKAFKAHILFDKIVANTRAKYIVVSYSNDGILSKDFIEASLRRYGKAETFCCERICYKQYLNWKAVSDNEHFEYVFFVEKKATEDIVYEAPLNYAGSKAKMIGDIRGNMPSTIDRVFDVFGGGFNVGVNVPSKHVFYNDQNYFVSRLIESFRKTDTYEYLMYIRKVTQKYDLGIGHAEQYVKARAAFNAKPEAKRDIKFLYVLILYGFQQQIRFNSNHEFNNPPGNRWFNDCVLEKMISFSRRIKELYCTFIQNDFGNVTPVIRPGDFVYLDPPYRLTCGSYNDGKRGFGGWTEKHETALFDFMDEMDSKKVNFLFSYIMEKDGKINIALMNWLQQRPYRVINVKQSQGRYGRRKEILVKNYE